MIEVGNHPSSRFGPVMLHSTESGQFFACERVEFERLAAAIKRGDLDDYLGRKATSLVADGEPDWTIPGLREERKRIGLLLSMIPSDARPPWAADYADLI